MHKLFYVSFVFLDIALYHFSMASWNAAAARCQFSAFPPFAHSASCASSPGIDEPTSSAISSNLFAASGVTIGGLMRILLSFAVFLRLFCSVIVVIFVF